MIGAFDTQFEMLWLTANKEGIKKLCLNGGRPLSRKVLSVLSRDSLKKGEINQVIGLYESLQLGQQRKISGSAALRRSLAVGNYRAAIEIANRFRVSTIARKALIEFLTQQGLGAPDVGTLRGIKNNC